MEDTGIQPNYEKPCFNGWLRAFRANPQMPSREVQAALQERFGIRVSIGHLNRVRAQLGIGNHVGRSKKNSKRPLLLLDRSSRKALALCSSSPLRDASRLLDSLRACTSLLCVPCSLTPCSSLFFITSEPASRTLLFLGVAGLSRTWDLRGYTGDALGLLTGRSRSYGYFHTERFLADVASSNGAEVLTGALAKWTTGLWQAEDLADTDKQALFYIDGHRKPV